MMRSFICRMMAIVAVMITSHEMMLCDVVHAQVVPGAVMSPGVKQTMTVPRAFTPEQLRAWESSLRGTPDPTDGGDKMPSVLLQWAPLEGASYRILRYATLSSVPAVITPTETGSQYVASLLPGKSFYFRIVVIGAGGAAFDTTSAYAITPQALSILGDGDIHNDVKPLPGTCSSSPPSTVQLSWTRRPDIADFHIWIIMHSGNSSPATNTFVTSSTFTQSGLPPGPYTVTVSGDYVLQDYPTPGQVTRTVAQFAAWNTVLPGMGVTPCVYTK